MTDKVLAKKQRNFAFPSIQQGDSRTNEEHRAQHHIASAAIEGPAEQHRPRGCSLWNIISNACPHSGQHSRDRTQANAGALSSTLHGRTERDIEWQACKGEAPAPCSNLPLQ